MIELIIIGLCFIVVAIVVLGFLYLNQEIEEMFEQLNDMRESNTL